MQIALMDRIADFVPKRGEWAYLGRLSFFVFYGPLDPVPWALYPVPFGAYMILIRRPISAGRFEKRPAAI